MSAATLNIPKAMRFQIEAQTAVNNAEKANDAETLALYTKLGGPVK